jgi:hypothetical protein
MTKHTLTEPDVFSQFVKPGEVVEIRVIEIYGKSPAWASEWAKGTVNGYFDDHAAFCRAVAAVEKSKHGGCYFTLQVIDPRLIGRSFNRLSVSKQTTSDRDVLAFRWLPVDLDPVRPAGISSSDAELAAAVRLRDEIAGSICADYKLPEPIRAVSGNGVHLLYPLPDLPVLKYAEAVKKIIEDISTKYSTPEVSIDGKVFNPARIWKLCGTTARKGDPVPEGPHRAARPHRLSYIDHLPGVEVPI